VRFRTNPGSRMQATPRLAFHLTVRTNTRRVCDVFPSISAALHRRTAYRFLCRLACSIWLSGMPLLELLRLPSLALLYLYSAA
jgi:hypothetical protein